MVYTLRFFFSTKCSLFHNSNVFGSCFIHILYTGCAKIKKNNSGPKSLRPKHVAALNNKYKCFETSWCYILNIGSLFDVHRAVYRNIFL